MTNARTSHHNSAMLVSIVTFFISLVFFHFNCPYYLPITLEVVGQASPGASVKIRWESDNGFNAYEHHTLELTEQSASGITSFTRRFDLPQVRIHRVEISADAASTVVVHELSLRADGRTISPKVSDESLRSPLLVDLSTFDTREFNGLLLGLQILYAVFCSWLAWVVVTFRFQSGKRTWREFLDWVVRRDQHSIFWAFFLVSTATFSIWLLAFWPAQMTNDSWITLIEMRSLKLTDWHPYIYTIYNLFFWQFGQTFASVAIGQIVLTAALGASIFYFAWVRGANRIVLLAVFAVFATSIPIGLLNLTIWKDVPFSLAVTGLGFLVFAAAFQREFKGQPFSIPAVLWPGFTILLLLALHSRHNGAILYPLLPILFFRRIVFRQYITLLVLLVAMFVTVNILVPRALGILKLLRALSNSCEQH